MEEEQKALLRDGGEGEQWGVSTSGNSSFLNLVFCQSSIFGAVVFIWQTILGTAFPDACGSLTAPEAGGEVRGGGGGGGGFVMVATTR